MSPTPPVPSSRRAKRTQHVSGSVAISVGLVCFVLSQLFESGFLHGLFQGATIALMCIGAYLFGAGFRQSRHPDDISPHGQWLPSRDSTRQTD